MNLKDKLRHLDAIIRSQPSQEPSANVSDIHLYVEGEDRCNEFGSFFSSSTVFPVNHAHGRVFLNDLTDSDENVLEWVGKDPALGCINLKRAIYLDTETTGLAGGVGTVPFLVGLGYWSEDGFRIDQLFMRDFKEERAVLEEVRRWIERSDVIVSYNGKAYDVNLLQSRFTLARFNTKVFNRPHIDLLFTVRRLWRRRIGDCTLSNIERHVLKFFREDDIPGYEIPSIYFDYLRTKNGRLMQGIFTHNRWDIISLVTLLAVAVKIYSKPHAALTHSLDFFSLGRALEAVHRTDQAIRCYESALTHPMGSKIRTETLRYLGFCYKRLGRWDHAVETWEAIIQEGLDDIQAYEELAKYHEHRTKQIEIAIDFVSRALQKLELADSVNFTTDLDFSREGLEYRLGRLRRKKEKRRTE